jgi:putative transposase
MYTKSWYRRIHPHRILGAETPSFSRGRKRRSSFRVLPACGTRQHLIEFTRTICCKLDVDGPAEVLAVTQRAFNEAATWIAGGWWAEGITNRTTAHHRASGEPRAMFALGAQLAVCARMKAVEAIKAVKAVKAVKAKHRETCPQCGPHGRVRYDAARTYRLMSLERVALNTLQSRIVCRLVLGDRQRAMLSDADWEVGGADLVWRAGVYYLHVTQSGEAAAEHAPDGGMLGVDLGIVNRATDSAGERCTGARVHRVHSAHSARTRSHLRRQRLQQVGTRNAKCRLRQRTRREARVQKDVNHCSSKQLVAKAAVSRTAIARENLRGIGERITVRREQRDERHSWAFFQLRQYSAYKAAQVGVPVYVVDPR